MDEPDLGVYAMYLRKSRADAEKERQGEDTLAKHERELSAFSAARRYLVDESDVYREVVSGESVADRKEFQRLMQGVTQRRYKGVIVKAIDRLGRGDIMEYGWILSTFQWTRTLIITPDKVYNPNDQADMQSLQLQMLISNGELKAAKARLAAGRAQSVRDGQYIGTIPPYGYDRTVVDRMHTLKPNDRAPIVVVIFELAASGWGASAIANKLNRAGIPAFGGGLWIPSVIKRILRNPVYKGYVRWRYYKTEVVSRDGLAYDKRRVLNIDGDDYIEVKGLHEPIVSDELWERANAALRPSVKLKGGQKITNPLAGLMFCSRCGKAVGRHVTYYRGRSRARYLHSRYQDCPAKSASEEAVMDTLISSLQSAAADLEYLAEHRDEEAERAAAEREALEREIAAASRRADKIVELYTADLIGIDEFRARRSPIDEQIARMRKRAEELDSAEPPDRAAQLVKVREAIGLLSNESIDAEEKNRMLRLIVERIEYTNEGDKRRRTGNLHLDVHLR